MRASVIVGSGFQSTEFASEVSNVNKTCSGGSQYRCGLFVFGSIGQYLKYVPDH